MTFRQYEPVKNYEDEQAATPVSSWTADVMLTMLKEGVRIMTAMGAVLFMLWTFAQPWADRYIDGRIIIRWLAPMADVNRLETRVNRVEEQSMLNGNSLIQFNEKMSNVETLLTEQRGDIKALLRKTP